MKKLYRSRRDRKLFGLCGGLAESMNVDPTLLRLVMVVATFFSSGALIPLYLIACIVIPKEPTFESPFGMAPPAGFGGGPGYTGHSGYTAQPPVTPQATHVPPVGQPDSHLDTVMKEIEQKAMRKEIEELREKLTRLEQAQKTKSDDSKGDV